MKNKAALSQSSTLVRSIRFPIQFDPILLDSEVRKILKYNWVSHYHTTDYEGDWNLLALMSVDGSQNSILTNDSLDEPLKNTPLLETSPYLQQIVNSFPFEKTAVRLMRLAAGSHIKPHTDHCLGYEDGVFRLHIPLITNADVFFFLDGQRLFMQPGECWYINANFTHEVANKGSEDRIHLVIDGIRNAWTNSLFFAHADEKNFQKPVQEQDIRNLELMIRELELNGNQAELLQNSRRQLQELIKRSSL